MEPKEERRSSVRYGAGVRERAVGMVLEHAGGRAWQREAIGLIAAKIGCSVETLRKGVGQAARERGVRCGPRMAEQSRIKALEREIRERRQANEILRQASVYVAMGELDRRSKP